MSNPSISLAMAQQIPATHKAQDDPNASHRKADHIQLAFEAQIPVDGIDRRFSYEPLLAAHPQPGSLGTCTFGSFKLPTPIWVSSMTGGTERAQTINHNLARACAEFGMGMGLGSCRPLLYDQSRLADFDMRDLIGKDLPFYANLGIAQIEHLIKHNELGRVEQMLHLLRADGLIVHVNPLQEWLQPEGDRFEQPPLQTIESLIEQMPNLSIIVKEVGQGMGPASLRALLALPITAIEFAAGGGTNFSRLELLRSDPVKQAVYKALEHVGHSASDMVLALNEAVEALGPARRCQHVIISGGVSDFLDGHYLRSKCNLPSLYGQASAFLRHATGDYEELRQHIAAQVRGLELAQAYLQVL